MTDLDHAVNNTVAAGEECGPCILATHATDIHGPPDALATYLKAHAEWLVAMKFPLASEDALRPHCEVFRRGELLERREVKILLKPFILNYAKDVLLTLYWGMTIVKKYKLTRVAFFGCNNVVAMAGLALKRLRRVRTMVFYSIDYSDRRFHNQSLDRLYGWIDRMASTRADVVWSNTNRTRAVRARQGVAEAANVLVPNGVYANLIGQTGRDGRDPHGGGDVRMEYHGHLTESKGVQALIHALDKLDDPSFTLDVIGSGPFEKELQDIAGRSKHRNRIRFLGRRPYEETVAALSAYDLSVALISPKEDYIRYCDPVKIKEALASNVPVLVSNVPEVAELIERERLGIVVEDGEDVDEIAQKLQELFGNAGMLREFKGNIAGLRESFDWNTIYAAAMRPISARLHTPR